MLELLGGLPIVPSKSAKAVFGTGALKVDPLCAAEGESARITDREHVVSDRLCLVGEWLGEYIVPAGSEGKVYAETTFQLLHLGRHRPSVGPVDRRGLAPPLLGRTPGDALALIESSL